MPLIFCEALVIFRIDYSEFALCQRDFPVGAAVAKPAIQKQQYNQRPFQPGWNSDSDNELDDDLVPPPS